MNEEALLIKILKCYLNGLSLDFEVNDKLINLAMIHNVAGIVKIFADKNNVVISEKNRAVLDKAFISSVFYSTKQDKELIAVKALLNKNNIHHLLTKGAVIKKLYREPDLRTMGDIDILVKKEDIEKTIIVMKKAGYTITNTYLKEITFSKNDIVVEIHTSLMEENMETGFDYIGYYSHIFNKAKLVEENTYELTLEDHLIYLIAHIGKHMYNEGCGIRLIMDIAVFCNSYSGIIDWKYTLSELKNIALDKLADNIFYLCNRYFDTRLPINIKPMSEELYTAITDYIMSGGVYGFCRENAVNKAVRKYQNNRLKMLKEYVFPNSEKMRELCLWYRNKPKIFLPVAWCIRAVGAMKKGKSFTDKLEGYKDSRVTEEIKLIKDMGLG